jgi:hypothetical protein
LVCEMRVFFSNGVLGEFWTFGLRVGAKRCQKNQVRANQ